MVTRLSDGNLYAAGSLSLVCLLHASTITQGQGLLMAITRSQVSQEPPQVTTTADQDEAEEPFVPEEEEEGTFTQGDGLMMVKARRSPSKPFIT